MSLKPTRDSILIVLVYARYEIKVMTDWLLITSTDLLAGLGGQPWQAWQGYQDQKATRMWYASLMMEVCCLLLPFSHHHILYSR